MDQNILTKTATTKRRSSRPATLYQNWIIVHFIKCIKCYKYMIRELNHDRPLWLHVSRLFWSDRVHPHSSPCSMKPWIHSREEVLPVCHSTLPAGKCLHGAVPSIHGVWAGTFSLYPYYILYSHPTEPHWKTTESETRPARIWRAHAQTPTYCLLSVTWLAGRQCYRKQATKTRKHERKWILSIYVLTPGNISYWSKPICSEVLLSLICRLGCPPNVICGTEVVHSVCLLGWREASRL